MNLRVLFLFGVLGLVGGQELEVSGEGLEAAVGAEGPEEAEVAGEGGLEGEFSVDGGSFLDQLSDFERRKLMAIAEILQRVIGFGAVGAEGGATLSGQTFAAILNKLKNNLFATSVLGQENILFLSDLANSGVDIVAAMRELSSSPEFRNRVDSFTNYATNGINYGSGLAASGIAEFNNRGSNVLDAATNYLNSLSASIGNRVNAGSAWAQGKVGQVANSVSNALENGNNYIKGSFGGAVENIGGLRGGLQARSAALTAPEPTPGLKVSFSSDMGAAAMNTLAGLAGGLGGFGAGGGLGGLGGSGGSGVAGSGAGMGFSMGGGSGGSMGGGSGLRLGGGSGGSSGMGFSMGGGSGGSMGGSSGGSMGGGSGGSMGGGLGGGSGGGFGLGGSSGGGFGLGGSSGFGGRFGNKLNNAVSMLGSLGGGAGGAGGSAGSGGISMGMAGPLGGSAGFTASLG